MAQRESPKDKILQHINFLKKIYFAYLILGIWNKILHIYFHVTDETLSGLNKIRNIMQVIET